MNFKAEFECSRSGVAVLSSNLGRPLLSRVRTRAVALEDPGDSEEPCRVRGVSNGVWIDLVIRKLSKKLVSVDGRATRGEETIRLEFWSEQREFLGENHTQVGVNVDSLGVRGVDTTTGEVLVTGQLIFRRPCMVLADAGENGCLDTGLVRLTQDLWEKYRQRRLPVPKPWYGMIFGEGELMREMVRNIDQAARSDSTMVVRGPSGAGKELVAKAIHSLSRRSEKPFIAANCATFNSLDPSVPLCKLFGIGINSGLPNVSPLGAPGLFAQADGGTLFLDEIHKLPLAVQAALLRVLDGYGYSPGAGRQQTIFNNVRLIVATNVDLQSQVDRGQFLSDLFYRIGSSELTVPSLRQRRSDIPLLLAHFLENKSSCALDLFSALLWYHWPGNVRELQRVAEQIKQRPEEPVSLAAMRRSLLNKAIVADLDLAHERFRKAKQKLAGQSGANLVVDKLVEITQQLLPAVFNAYKNGHSELVLPHITEAQRALGNFLVEQKRAPADIPWRGTVYEMLRQIVPERKALTTLRACFKRLQELHVKVSSHLEQPRYSTLVLFFGLTFEQLRHPGSSDGEGE